MSGHDIAGAVASLFLTTMAVTLLIGVAIGALLVWGFS